jgi:putative membrane protein
MAGSALRSAVVAGVAVGCALLAGCTADDPATAAVSPTTTTLTVSPTTTTVTASPSPTVTVTRSPSPVSPSPTTTVPGSEFSAQDRGFLVDAHQANLAEIAAGRNAGVRATSAQVRDVARQFVADHQQFDAVVQQYARAAALPLPSTPTRAQQAALADVADERGTAYDRAWIAQQMRSHEDLLELLDREITAGRSTGVRQAAQREKSVVLAHMDLLDRALRQLTGTSPTRIAAGDGGQAAVGDVTLPVLLMGLGAASVAAGGVLLVRRRRAAEPTA